MKSIVLALAALLAGTAAAEAPDFYAHWGDGRAEISSYQVIQPRYGEPREGYAVLIFVTEEINRKTFIKVESPTPVEDRIYVREPYWNLKRRADERFRKQLGITGK